MKRMGLKTTGPPASRASARTARSIEPDEVAVTFECVSSYDRNRATLAKRRRCCASADLFCAAIEHISHLQTAWSFVVLYFRVAAPFDMLLT